SSLLEAVEGGYVISDADAAFEEAREHNSNAADSRSWRAHIGLLVDSPPGEGEVRAPRREPSPPPKETRAEIRTRIADARVALADARAALDEERAALDEERTVLDEEEEEMDHMDDHLAMVARQERRQADRDRVKKVSSAPSFNRKNVARVSPLTLLVHSQNKGLKAGKRLDAHLRKLQVAQDMDSTKLVKQPGAAGKGGKGGTRGARGRSVAESEEEDDDEADEEEEDEEADEEEEEEDEREADEDASSAGMRRKSPSATGHTSETDCLSCQGQKRKHTQTLQQHMQRCHWMFLDDEHRVQLASIDALGITKNSCVCSGCTAQRENSNGSVVSSLLEAVEGGYVISDADAAFEEAREHSSNAAASRSWRAHIGLGWSEVDSPPGEGEVRAPRREPSPPPKETRAAMRTSIEDARAALADARAAFADARAVLDEERAVLDEEEEEMDHVDDHLAMVARQERRQADRDRVKKVSSAPSFNRKNVARVSPLTLLVHSQNKGLKAGKRLDAHLRKLQVAQDMDSTKLVKQPGAAGKGGKGGTRGARGRSVAESEEEDDDEADEEEEDEEADEEEEDEEADEEEEEEDEREADKDASSAGMRRKSPSATGHTSETDCLSCQGQKRKHTRSDSPLEGVRTKNRRRQEEPSTEGGGRRHSGEAAADQHDMLGAVLGI
ncbi:hypothetical protein TeGR_g15239, partial [Tetraparma gracilis]